VRASFAFLVIALAMTTMQPAFAEAGSMTLPETVEAGNAFSIQSRGSGKAML
jgi:hypothetical protein